MMTFSLSNRTLAPTSSPRAGAGNRLVLNEDVFRTAIARERKRADRFAERMALVSVSAKRSGAAVDWTSVIDALAAVKRPSDPVGWTQSRVTLGILVPEIS